LVKELDDPERNTPVKVGRHQRNFHYCLNPVCHKELPKHNSPYNICMKCLTNLGIWTAGVGRRGSLSERRRNAKYILKGFFLDNWSKLTETERNHIIYCGWVA